MRNPIVPFLGLLFVVGLAQGASSCTVETVATLDTPEGTFYVYNDACQLECLFSVWVVEEENGQPGLQRVGDEFEPATCE